MQIQLKLRLLGRDKNLHIILIRMFRGKLLSFLKQSYRPGELVHLRQADYTLVSYCPVS